MTTLTKLDLTALRPVDGSAAAIRAAVARADMAVTEMVEAERAALAARDAGLIDATPAALAKAEATLAAARDDGERARAVLRQLEERLAAAERAETLAAVQAAAEACTKARTELEAWWTANGPPIFEQFRRGLALSNATGTTWSDFSRASRLAAQRYPDAVLPQPEGTGGDANGWMDTVKTRCAMGYFPEALEAAAE